MKRFDRILVPVDFSPSSYTAMETALDLASPETHVDLLHVLELPDFPGFYQKAMQKMYGDMPDLRDAARSSLHAWMEEAASRHKDVGTHIREGHAATEIIDAAGMLRSDLIVVSTHGRTGLQHVLLGSVAEHIVRNAACPVLVLRSFATNTAPQNEA